MFTQTQSFSYSDCLFVILKKAHMFVFNKVGIQTIAFNATKLESRTNHSIYIL